MAKRKPRVVYSWRAVTRADVSKVKPHTLAGRRIVGYVCDWKLIGANGEFIIGSYPQGFRDRTDALRSVITVTLALTGQGLPEVLPFKEEGPGPRPLLDTEQPPLTEADIKALAA